MTLSNLVFSDKKYEDVGKEMVDVDHEFGGGVSEFSADTVEEGKQVVREAADATKRLTGLRRKCVRH